MPRKKTAKTAKTAKKPRIPGRAPNAGHTSPAKRTQKEINAEKRITKARFDAEKTRSADVPRRTPPMSEDMDYVEITAFLLSRRFRPGEIRRELTKIRGNGKPVAEKVVEELVAKARVFLRAQYLRSREDQIQDALGLYETIIASEVSAETMIRAQEAINKLLGLEYRETPDAPAASLAIQIQKFLSNSTAVEQDADEGDLDDEFDPFSEED